MAQCRLGELTAKIDKAKNQYSASPSLGLAKKEQLKPLGISKQRASEYERMEADAILLLLSNSGVTKRGYALSISHLWGDGIPYHH